MWWPALGAIAVGIVGYIAPSTLGVGYENISTAISGEATMQVLLILCFLKLISWSISLGSGTSGGTLAPMLTIGGAAGALLGTGRSEEHTSELQSLMRISYDVFCLTKQIYHYNKQPT